MGPRARRFLMAIAAPLSALVIAVAVSSLVLVLTGSSPVETFRLMLEYGSRLETMIDTLNRATPLFLSGIAAAIGFRMNLFNIGVEGQYLLGAFVGAAVGAELELPRVLHLAVIIGTAMLVSALWAGLAGVLKVSRGINEVISTIMLNYIALGIVAALLPYLIADPTAANQGTKKLPESGWLPDLNGVAELFTREIQKGRHLTGMFAIAILVGIIYHVVLQRTRFGFDLRASGMNPFAARAGGVPARRMVLASMMLGGAVAGLVGMPEIVSNSYAYDQGFVRGLGFAGIAVALLGRNRALGIGLAALLFGFLDSSSAILQVSGSASKEIVGIMQAIILLAAVIAYQIVQQISQRDEVRRASAFAQEPSNSSGTGSPGTGAGEQATGAPA